VGFTFGLIGAGKWGKHYIRVIREAGHNLKTVVVQTEQRKKELEEQGIRASLYPSAIFDDPEISVVVVAAPPKTHYTFVRAALISGKHVLCEKPLTDNLKTTLELKKIYDELPKKPKVMVGYQYLHNTYIHELKKQAVRLKDQKRFFAWHLSFKELRHVDVGLVWDAACHFLSILIYLFGVQRLELFNAQKLDYGREDSFCANLWLDNGVTAVITLTNHAPKKGNSMHLISENEYFSLEQDGLMAKFTQNKKEIKLPYPEPLAAQLNYFIACIIQDRQPDTNLDHSVKVARMLSALEGDANG
jgi:predicted dehydrogenase